AQRVGHTYLLQSGAVRLLMRAGFTIAADTPTVTDQPPTRAEPLMANPLTARGWRWDRHRSQWAPASIASGSSQVAPGRGDDGKQGRCADGQLASRLRDVVGAGSRCRCTLC